MLRPKQRKDLGNGVCPPSALGVKYPIWRLGALVSLPYSIGKVIMVQIPDRSLSLKQMASCTAGKTFPPFLPLNRSLRTANPGESFQLSRTDNQWIKPNRKASTPQRKAISARPGYGFGSGRQGIARHAPPCPAALHLDCPTLRQQSPLGIALRRVLC
jgi:hypothetical protein